jgi:hypothetical protein
MKHPALATTCLLLACLPVLAADTIETWDRHAGNVELYSRLEGLGQAGGEQAVGGAMLLGYGLTQRFSAYLATTLSADGYLMGAQTELNLGAFGTPLDTDHLDLDLLLDIRVADGGGPLAVTPALELNLDRKPELAAYGLYLRAAGEVAGQEAIAGARPGRRLALGLTLGGYWSLTSRSQLLLEVDATVHDEPAPGTPAFERGALALGFNTLVGESLELITETRYDLPQDGVRGAAGFMVGLIATLPGIAD